MGQTGRSILDDSLGYQLGVTYRKTLHTLIQRFKPYDITPEQFTVLVRLSEEDGIHQKELASRTARDQPTLTRILDLLERKGMIRKETDPSDRRAFLLFVTKEGEKIIDILTPIEQSYNRELFSGMNREDIEKFRHSLELLLKNAERLSK